MSWHLLLALSSAALHVLLERLALRDVGLLRLGVVRVEGGRLRIAGVRLGVWNKEDKINVCTSLANFELNNEF